MLDGGHRATDFAPQNHFEKRPRIHVIPTIDPYKDSDGNFSNITETLERRVAEGFDGNPYVDLNRKRSSDINYSNPPTAWMYENLPGFADWHSLIPSAAALEPLYSPEVDVLANGKPFTPEMRSWMCNIYDAIGIRSRAEAMKSVIIGEVLASPDEQHAWVSLGCGAAQPVFSALSSLRSYELPIPKVTLVDYQPQALTLAEEGARAAGFADNVETKRMNILRPRGISYTRRSQMGLYTSLLEKMGNLPAESYDMVDAVGILEYLQPEDWPYTYKKVIKTKKNMAGTNSFLKNAYELVKPGGILLVGNMRDTHPQLGFTLNTIQWPHIQPRSVESTTGMIREAGLNGELDVYCPDDNVYAIYVIRKH